MEPNNLERKMFPIRLRGLREEYRIKPFVLSHLCGIHDTAVKEYEDGDRMPSSENLVKIADFFMVSTFVS